MGREQLNLMPERLDQAALAVRTTLVVIGTRREGSNFRPLRCHASAGAIFQKARTRPALTMRRPPRKRALQMAVR
jgi:hypothetical protein